MKHESQWPMWLFSANKFYVKKWFFIKHWHHEKQCYDFFLWIYRPDSVVGIATSYGLDDRGVGFRVPVGWLWEWIIWWNEDLQGKYSEKTCPSATLSTNPTWPDPGMNPGCRGGKPATNRLSYSAANTEPLLHKFSTGTNPKTLDCHELV
jgi:hypothetical protein